MRIDFSIGTWRSLVARYTGGVEVAGSNPVVPTYGSTSPLRNPFLSTAYEQFKPVSLPYGDWTTVSASPANVFHRL